MNRKTWDEWQSIRDKEEMAEYVKAYEIAAQYKMNSDRIKRLLSFNPVTRDNGQLLVSGRKSRVSGIILFDGYFKSLVNPVLLSP